MAPGAVEIALAADGRFVGIVGANAAGSRRGVAQSGDDPTQRWSLVPALAEGNLAGTSTRRPLVFVGGRVLVARDGRWDDVAPQLLPGGGTILAIDAAGRWVVRLPDGTLKRVSTGGDELIFRPEPEETPVVAPDGRVFGVSQRTADDLLLYDGGKRTPLLGTTGCGQDPGCPRAVRVVGFDDDGGVYASVIAPDGSAGIPLFRYRDGSWSALPFFEYPGPEGQISCGVSGSGDVYCMSSEDFGNKLYRLGNGDDAWNDLGLVPTTSACNVQPRNDGRIAMRCGALSIQSGNSELFVSRN